MINSKKSEIQNEKWKNRKLLRAKVIKITSLPRFMKVPSPSPSSGAAHLLAAGGGGVGGEGASLPCTCREVAHFSASQSCLILETPSPPSASGRL